MPTEDDEPISEWERHEGNSDWYDMGEETYEDILDEMVDRFGADVIDQHAADLMYDVWFNADTTSVDRAWEMWEFFEYTGLDWDDFDWEAWREWYEG